MEGSRDAVMFEMPLLELACLIHLFREYLPNPSCSQGSEYCLPENNLGISTTCHFLYYSEVSETTTTNINV